MLLCALPGGAAYAQAYPHKPIRMINPFSPSGAPGRAAFSAMNRGPGIKAVGMRAD